MTGTQANGAVKQMKIMRKSCEIEENHCHFEMPQTSAPAESLSEATLAELRDLRRLGEKTSGGASDALQVRSLGP